MTPSFELNQPDRFTAAAIGEPGRRVFYVQGVEAATVVTLKLEKTQVAALAQYMAELLADLPAVDDREVPLDVELAEPAVAEWVVGSIGVAFDDGRDRMVLTFQELQVAEEGAETGDDGGALATFLLTRAQAMAFVRRAAQLVASGRPACSLCGRPIDPEGHVCIKTNGHLH